MSLKDEVEEVMLPEAKSSVTYNIVSPSGYSMLFTLRSGDSGELLSEMKDMEEYFKKEGYTPNEWKTKGGAKVNETSKAEDVCPKCGSPLIKFTTKAGKSGSKCSTATYDWETKKAGGCDYVKWDDAPVQTTIQGEKATPAQENLLKSKNLWEEGMSKSEASKKISSVLGK